MSDDTTTSTALNACNGCGRTLTTDEKAFYGSMCESCEGSWHLSISNEAPCAQADASDDGLPPLVTVASRYALMGKHYVVVGESRGWGMEHLVLRTAALAREAVLRERIARAEHGNTKLATLATETLRERNEARERADKAEAELEVANAKIDVMGGWWCAKNRARGRRPCEACAWCCKQERDARAKAEVELALLQQEWWSPSKAEAEHEAVKALLDEARHAIREAVVVLEWFKDGTAHAACRTRLEAVLAKVEGKG